VENISRSLSKIIDAAGLRKRMILAMAALIWEDCVGAEIARHTRVERVKNGTLFVVTDSAVWSQELSFLKPQIIAQLNARLEEPVVADIRFRTQGKSSSREQTRAPLFPRNYQLESIALSEAQSEIIISSTAHVRDEELQEVLRSWAEKMLKLREWNKRHPLRYCANCRLRFRSHRRKCPECGKDVR